jgi:hypothetical protein
MQPSIWESPTDVVSKGLFGGAQASQALKRGGAARKAEASRAAAAKVLASVDEGNKQQGPLPQVRLLETLNPQHAILDPRPSTLNPQPSTPDHADALPQVRRQECSQLWMSDGSAVKAERV